MMPQGREGPEADGSAPSTLPSDAGDVKKHRRRDRLEADARSYLNKHQVLSWVQDVIQDLVQDRPEDPWDYIVGGIASKRGQAAVPQNAKVEESKIIDVGDIRLRMRTALSQALDGGQLLDALQAMPQQAHRQADASAVAESGNSVGTTSEAPDSEVAPSAVGLAECDGAKPASPAVASRCVDREMAKDDRREIKSQHTASYAAEAQAQARKSAARAAALAAEIASSAGRERSLTVSVNARSMTQAAQSASEASQSIPSQSAAGSPPYLSSNASPSGVTDRDPHHTPVAAPAAAVEMLNGHVDGELPARDASFRDDGHKAVDFVKDDDAPAADVDASKYEDDVEQLPSMDSFRRRNADKMGGQSTPRDIDLVAGRALQSQGKPECSGGIEGDSPWRLASPHSQGPNDAPGLFNSPFSSRKPRGSPMKCESPSTLLSLCGEGGSSLSPSSNSVSRKSFGTPINRLARSLEARGLLQELLRGDMGQERQTEKPLPKIEEVSGLQRKSPASKSTSSKQRTDVFKPTTDIPMSPGPPRGAAPAAAGSAAKAAFSLNRPTSLPAVARTQHVGRLPELCSPGKTAIELHIQMRNAQCRQENEDLRKENLRLKAMADRPRRRSSCEPLDAPAQAQMEAVRTELGRLFQVSKGL